MRRARGPAQQRFFKMAGIFAGPDKGDSEKPHPGEIEDPSPSPRERLLDWFQQNRAQLDAWAAESGAHAILMLLDPLTAIREAGLVVPQDLIPELQRAAKAIRGYVQSSVKQ